VLFRSQATYFHVLCQRVPVRWGPITVFKGIEANILDYDGNTDIPDYVRPFFDLVLAYMHPITVYKDGGRDKNTAALLNAFEKNPAIDILAHPVANWYDYDMARVVEEACQRGIALELNETTLSSKELNLEKMRILAETTLKYDGKFALSSDAHLALELGGDKEIQNMVRKFGIPEKNILNSSLEKVWAYIESRRSMKK
jgi:putative hydrolase